jgi:biotin carboxyl carrier protein
MIFEFTYVDETYTVNVERKDDSFIVAIGDRQIELDAQEVSPGCLSILKEGESQRVYVAGEEGVIFVDVDGIKYRLDEIMEGAERAGSSAGMVLGAGGALLMPMPGKVIKINVKEGDAVEAGQTLVVIESMKMEQPVKTPVAGTVKKVNVTEGQQVDLEETLLEVEPTENPDSGE